MFGFNFKTGPDPLDEKVTSLLQVGNFFALGSLPIASETYQNTSDTINHDDWVFFATIAFSLQAQARLKMLDITEKRRQGLVLNLLKEFGRWNSRGPDAALDCIDFIEKFRSDFSANYTASSEEHLLLSDSVATWLMWNILGRAPNTEKDSDFARKISLSIKHQTRDYWKLG
jgi:hypothetical protein